MTIVKTRRITTVRWIIPPIQLVRTALVQKAWSLAPAAW
jgi:hypothetical protein